MSDPDLTQPRAQERRALAREVSDALTHRLATVSLQVMGHLDSADLVGLRSALRGIGRSADSALAELRVLLRVLRDEPGSTDSAGLPGLELTMGPTAAAAAWAGRLSLAGHRPTVEVPVEADRLELTTQRTICRIFEVTSDQVVQHAAPGSPCSITVVVHLNQVVVRALVHLSADPGSVALDPGLLGLQERIDLVGGTFTAGPLAAGTGEWAVQASLPRS